VGLGEPAQGSEVDMKAAVGHRVLMLLENNPFPQDPRPRREARALMDAGYRVSIICPAEPRQPWRECVDGVNVYRYPAPPEPGGVLGYLWEYTYSIVATFILSLVVFFREGVDIIHAHNPPDTFVFVAALYKMVGKRFVFDHHDLSPEMYLARFQGRGNPVIYKALIWAEKLSCRMADLVIATNESYKAVEIERGKIPEQRIRIVRNGPDKKTSPYVSDPRLRQSGKIMIGYFGVMGHQDGVDYLLRALHHLIYKVGRTDFCCVLVGDGDACDGLKALVEQLELSAHTQFVGWVQASELPAYIASVDICVAPEPSNSYNDRSTMIKIMEYMSEGKPIVAFDLPEHRYSAQNAALYVEPNDELKFAEAIAELMNDPGRRKQMGAFGQERVEGELAWSYSVQHLIDAYRMLSPHSVPAKRTAILAHFRDWPRTNLKRLARWLELRSSPYIANRIISLVKRYGLTSRKAKQRVLDCVELMAKYDCCPTFPTPGRVVKRDPEFFQTIQAMGAELNIHGYDHIDFLSLSREEANKQFVRAIEAFDTAGIRAQGFRCPYLSYSEALIDALPDRMKYSSNEAIVWDVLPDTNGPSTAVFGTLQEFYRAKPCTEAVSTPKITGTIVELPIGIPDDLQMFDGLKMDKEAIAQAWSTILRHTHRAGELFALLFHPELIDECKDAFEAVLRNARTLRPAVWVTQLRDVSEWWREKSEFTVEVSKVCSGQRLRLNCSERATIVIRDLTTSAATQSWEGRYQVFQGHELLITAKQRPFIGLSEASPAKIVSFLREQGFIVETGAGASECTMYLDDSVLTNCRNDRQVLDYIENSPEPLIRYWPWPNGAKSALCMTGDLDALGLIDYASRLYTK
jgi:glycosyltransferase involved in cell wall biosynthesis/peptidoglycan/xylan/chitin deacetylase (PgdA/CDA1 family)